MSGHPHQYPPAGGYALPPGTSYSASGAPLLSSQPLAVAAGQPGQAQGYDPYGGYAQMGGPYGAPPPPQQQPQRQQQYAGYSAPHPPPQHAGQHPVQQQQPPHAMHDPAALARVQTPSQYAMHSHPQVQGSPSIAGRQPPLPRQTPPIPPQQQQGAQLVGMQQPGGGGGAPVQPPAPSLATGSGQAGQGQGQASPQMPKARSAMACTLCRRQKMKCEGPEKAPCRRCRAAQVECVFEAPPAAPPRPRAGVVTEAWVESRFNTVEQRISTLEETSSSSLSLVRQQQQQSISPALISDHERRIAQLEAQLYALQLATARQASQVQIPPVYSSPSGGHGPQALEQSGSAGAGYAAAAAFAAPYPPSSATSVGAAGHFVSDVPSGSGSGAGIKHDPEGVDGPAGFDAHREKRWKGDPLLATPASGASASFEPDFIARGVVSEEEAQMCFESYHLTFAHAPTSAAPPQTHLPFDETRRRSPLFLATVISIGARSLSRFDTFHATYREAMRLAHLTFLPYADGGEDLSQLEPDSPPGPAGLGNGGASYIPFVPFGAPGSDAADAPKPRLRTLSLKALMLLGLYHAMPELLVHVWMLGYRFVLPTALLEFDELSEEEKASKVGRTLLNRGRVFLVGYLWLAFYTYSRGQQGFFDQPIELLRHHLDIIRRSSYAEHPTDHVIRVNLEECLILLNAFKQLGPGMGVRPSSDEDHEEVYRLVGDAIEKLVEWDREWKEGMDVLSQWGDSEELKSQVPFAHGRQCLLMYIFRDIPFAAIDRSNPRTREYARMGTESALVILRWGVESRIWMPFSMVGNYVNHVNIPTALFMLSVTARLYPEDTDIPSLRPLLHRLAKQCDVTMQHAGATPREVARAKRTKQEVLALDRWAFEHGDSDVLAAPAAAAGTVDIFRTGASTPATSNGGGTEDAGLFGHEITASLDSLRLELNLWAKPLRGFEEDL